MGARLSTTAGKRVQTVGATDAVIFDFDGVLAESQDIKVRAFVSLYEEHGPAVVDRVLEHHRANEGISRLVKIRHCHRDYLGVDLADEQLSALGRRYSDIVEAQVIAADWVPGAREILEAHHRSHSLFVVSGTPEDELRRIVERRGMTHYFVSVHGSPPGKAPIVRGLLKTHGLAADRVLFVGDAMADYDAAHATGVRFVGRVAPGRPDRFPAGTVTVPDLTGLVL